MNDLSHERGLLRRQIKNDVIDHMRARDSDGRLTLADVLIRGLVCRLKAFRLEPNLTPEMVFEKAYGRVSHLQQAMAVEALKAEPKRIAKAAVNPAMTTVSGWAAELVGTENYSGLLPMLMPASVYSQLAERGLRVPFADGIGVIKLPARLSSPLIAGDFVAEGAPIPTRRLGLAATSFGPPKKLAVLTHFSAELQEQSVPAIESVLRQAIADDTGNTLDAKLLDAVAGTTTRPAGLLNGVSATTATAGGGTAALAGDLGALAAAIPSPVDLVYLMTPADRVRAMTVAPGLVGVPIIEAAGLTAKTVIALDAADFVSGEGDTPRFDLSDQAVLHQDDAPVAIGTVGTPNVVAAPTASMFQMDLISMRMIWFVVWAMRRTGRVAFTSSVTW